MLEGLEQWLKKKHKHAQRKNIGKGSKGMGKNIGKGSKGMAEKDLAKIFTVVSY